MDSQKNFIEHQNRCVQSENHVNILNLKYLSDMPTYRDKVTEYLEKANWLEDPDEAAEASCNNVPLDSISAVAQAFYVPLEKEKYLSIFGEDVLTKFYTYILEKTGANIDFTFVKEQGLYITVFGTAEVVTETQEEIFKWCNEKDLNILPVLKDNNCFGIGQTGDKVQISEQQSPVNAQITHPRNETNCVNNVNIKKIKNKSSLVNLTSSAKKDNGSIQRLEREKTFLPVTVEPFHKTNDPIFQEKEEHILSPLSSPKDLDIDFNGKVVQMDQCECINKRIEKTQNKFASSDVLSNSQHNCTGGCKRNFLQEILERNGDLTDISLSESISDSWMQNGENICLREGFTEADSNTNDLVVSSIAAPSWLHRFIINNNGKNIAEITKNIKNVHIHFTNEDKIILKGPSEDVCHAQKQFEVIVNDLIRKMDYAELNSDWKFYQYLTGNNRAILNRISETNKVTISMVSKNKDNNLIRIEGKSPGVQHAKSELLALTAHLEHDQRKEIVIKHQFHHVIIGQKGERIREICKKFPDVILNFPHPSEKSDIVQLIGPKAESEQCAEYLENMLTDIKENNYSVTISILKRLHKRLIGKGGSNIKKISEATNTKISFPPESSNSEEFIITGYPENCEIARSSILSIQQEIVDTAEEEIVIPPNLHKSLTDSKDGLLTSVLEECDNVNIHFPKCKLGSQKVIITGPIENVEKAKEKFLELIEEERSKNYSVTLRVKSKYHQFLMHANGGNFSKVCKETGTSINFPPPNHKDKEYLTIIGKEEAVKQVQKELDALLKNLEDIFEDSILINRKFHHYFVMRRGQLLREMTEEYGGVIITFSYAGRQNMKVTIKGARACVEAAKKHIKGIFEPLGSQVTTRYVIPQKFHPFIMGPIFSRIQQIARDYKVQIKFPEAEKPVMITDLSVQERSKKKWRKNTKEPASSSIRRGDIVFISGQVENCKAATEALESLIPVTAEVHVPIHLHPYILGHKGNGLRKLMKEFEVYIEASQPGKNSDMSIMGLAANVEQAKIRLQKRVKSLQLEIEDRELKNFKLMFTLDPKYRPKIFGHKGLLITQICTEHDVTIHFPKKGSSDLLNQITIVGYRQNTLAARDAILRVLHKIEQTVSKEITLHHHVRGNIIGFRGRNIHKIMEQYQVDIRLPPKGSYNPNITLTGLPGNVQKAIDHIFNLEKYHVAALVNHGCQELIKSTSLCNVATTSSKNNVKKQVLFNARTTQKLPDVDNCEHFPRLKQRISSKTHLWKLCQQ